MKREAQSQIHNPRFEPAGLRGVDLLANFFSGSDSAHCFARLFESIPGVSLFIKDLDSRFIYGNQSLLDHLELSCLDQLTGTRDEDHFPPELCESFLKDDRQLFATGEPVIDRFEMGFNGRFVVEWFITTKIPVISKKGKITGLVGTSRICEDEKLMSQTINMSEVYQLVLWLKDNNDRRVTTTELAKVAGLSIHQLRRRFQDTFGMTPQEFELSSRIRAASRELIEDSQTVSEIAIRFGFCDQSAFSKQFKSRIGFTPSEFRNNRETSRL